MAELKKHRGHQLISFDTSGVMSDADGKVMLASKNRNPDPLFNTIKNNGRMQYWDLGKSPKPDGWGIFVKGPAASDDFSEQQGAPLRLGEDAYFDLDQPLVHGQPLPEKQDYIDIAQPEAPRTVIFLTADKGYPAGWYCAAHAYAMKDLKRVTTPDPTTAGFLGSRTDAFQLSSSSGIAFYIPTPPKDAYYIVFYLTSMQSTSTAALSAVLYQQAFIKIDDNPSNIFEFRGPLATGQRATTTNKTKLSEWGGSGRFHIRTDRTGGNNQHYHVQMAYELVDSSGHSVAAYTVEHNVPEDSGRHYEFHPDMSSLSAVAKHSVDGFTPYVRYKTDKDWGKWQKIKKKNADAVFPLDHFVPVWGPDWKHDGRYVLVKGQPSTKDTTGIPNPTEPMTAVDAVVSLTSSGLATGKHRIKTVLYDGNEPSEPSPATVVNITASNQAPRIYQPFFTNRLDNPELVDTAQSTNRPRDWTFNRDARTTYEKGRVAVDETDGQATRGDLIITPYGYIAMNELAFSGRVIVEIAKHVTGKAVDVLMEYQVTGYSATGVPTVNFIKQSTLGVHRKNGRYTLGFKLKNGTRKRDSIPLDPLTNLVVIKTIGDGSDTNLGVRNYLVYRRGHALFTKASPTKRKIGADVDKLDWLEPDDYSYPHGGYCNTITAGEDTSLTGITQNMTDTGFIIPTNTLLTGTSETEKTLEVRFKTGEDITTGQIVYRQGDGTNGYAIQILSGSIHFRVWQGGTTTVNITATVYKHTTYMASLVRHAGGLIGYLDGVQVATTATTVAAFSSGGSVSAGYNNGTFRTSTNTTSTTASPLLGRLMEIRAWVGARTASQVLSSYAAGLSDATGMALYLPMTEMEGSTVYDYSGNLSDATLAGDYRWINEEGKAAWRDDSGVIDKINFNANTLPSPWTATGTATNTLGDFSASRFSDYGMRFTGTGTNTRYITRTLPGGYTTLSMGIQARKITLPVGGSITLMQLVDGTGVVAEMQITAAGQLQVRGPGAGAWTTVLSGIEAGERLYFEMRLESLGTSSGTIRVFTGPTFEDELMQVGMLTGLTFTSRNVTSVRAGNCAVSATVTNTWDMHFGEVIVSTYGKVKKTYLPGNYIEYYGPSGTPVNEKYGPTGLSVPVVPGETITLSVYAACTELVSGSDDVLGGTFYNEDDEEIDHAYYLVQFPDIETEWRRYTLTLTVPTDAAYYKFDRNNVGEGRYRIQALQIETGSTATAFTAAHTLTGYVRVKLDSVTPGCDPGKPMDVLGPAIDLLSMDYTGYDPDNTSITLQIASSATKSGTYTSYYSDINLVPQNRWYEVKATLTTTRPFYTPILTSIFVRVQRQNPSLLGPDGTDYQGGTLINNMAGPVPRPLVETTQLDDGSGGYTAWGDGKNPPRYIQAFECHVFRDSTLASILGNVGVGESTFKIEYFGMLYTIRVIEPIEYEPRRINNIALTDEDEPFTHYVLTIPTSEVIDAQEQ